MARSQADNEREYEEMEAYARALEQVVHDLLGLAESAKLHFGHFNKAWEECYQQTKEQAQQLLFPDDGPGEERTEE